MKTPRIWRLGLLTAVGALTVFAYVASSTIGVRGQAMVGFVAFITLVAAFSQDLRAVRARTLICGILLQFLLAFLVLHVEPVRVGFSYVGKGIQKMIDVADEGSRFVFGPLAKPEVLAGPLGPDNAFIFAFKVLPVIIFISGFFSVLYYFGVLQFFVKVMARVMKVLMGTSGAETLSVSANVFMGQTEAPLIVKPFVPKMTKSELLALMGSGMAHVSGGLMAVYIAYATPLFGGNPEAAATSILITVIMACPCSLYLTKLLLPETEKPETMGDAPIKIDMHFVNPIDALASGITDGLRLALNVAAMLIGFIAMIALIDLLIGQIKPALLGIGLGIGSRSWWPSSWTASVNELDWWPDNLTLKHMMGYVFQPVAMLIGVPLHETADVGRLLGIKLVANEHVAFIEFTKTHHYDAMSQHSKTLVLYALTGFANFASVGIQLGGIGAIAEGRRHDLAKLGMRALFIGFTATLVNAAVAGILLP